MNYRPLKIVALLLVAVAAIGWFFDTPRDQTTGLIAILAIMILLSLPAVLFRMWGGSGFATWLISFLLPFGCFEIPLTISHFRTDIYRGGDLHGIDVDIMYIAGIIILMISSVVALVAIARYPRQARG